MEKDSDPATVDTGRIVEKSNVSAIADEDRSCPACYAEFEPLSGGKIDPDARETALNEWVPMGACRVGSEIDGYDGPRDRYSVLAWWGVPLRRRQVRQLFEGMAAQMGCSLAYFVDPQSQRQLLVDFLESELQARVLQCENQGC